MKRSDDYQIPILVGLPKIKAGVRQKQYEYTMGSIRHGGETSKTESVTTVHRQALASKGANKELPTAELKDDA